METCHYHNEVVALGRFRLLRLVSMIHHPRWRFVMEPYEWGACLLAWVATGCLLLIATGAITL